MYIFLCAGFAPAGSVITIGNICISAWFELLSRPSHLSLSHLLLYLVFFQWDSVEGSGCLRPPSMQQSFSDTMCTLYLICQIKTGLRPDCWLKQNWFNTCLKSFSNIQCVHFFQSLLLQNIEAALTISERKTEKSKTTCWHFKQKPDNRQSYKQSPLFQPRHRCCFCQRELSQSLALKKIM